MQAQIYMQALKMVLLPCYIMHYCTYITLYVLEHADVLTHDALCPMERKKKGKKKEKRRRSKYQLLCELWWMPEHLTVACLRSRKQCSWAMKTNTGENFLAVVGSSCLYAKG